MNPPSCDCLVNPRVARRSRIVLIGQHTIGDKRVVRFAFRINLHL